MGLRLVERLTRRPRLLRLARARKIGHQAALRQLANRLVGILHGCLKTGSLYDEGIAWAPHLTSPPPLDIEKPGTSVALADYRAFEETDRVINSRFASSTPAGYRFRSGDRRGGALVSALRLSYR
jgi:hypothetical protein